MVEPAPDARRGCSRPGSRAGLRLSPKERLGPRLVAGSTGFAQSTVWKMLRRPRLSRASAGRRSRPTAMMALPRRSVAHGHQPLRAVSRDPGTSHRRPLTVIATLESSRDRVGYDCAHSLVDDHSRLAYVELHRDEQRRHGHGIRRARPGSTSRSSGSSRNGCSPITPGATAATARCANCCTATRIKHRFIRPRRPQTNGKVERFQQTLKREWGLGPDLPPLRPPRPSTDTLAQPLQPTQTTQLTRRPATDQPRSQETSVGRAAS